MKEIVEESLDRYFNTLKNLGYKDYNNVYKLLTLVIIQDILEGEFKEYVTEESRDLLNKTLNCLYGSTCLIPYPN